MSTPAEIRAQAAQLLSQVADEGRSLDFLLENRSDAPQERGLLRSLSYGSVRWYWRLIAVLEQLSSQPPAALEPQVRALCIVGLYQLLHTDIAPHAAVAETVEAARVLKFNRATGFLNAILRRCQREAVELGKRVDRSLAVRTAHPQWLVEQLQHDWPIQTETILTCNNVHPPFWLRINQQRVSRDAYLAQLVESGIEAQISAHAPQALLLSQATDVQLLPGFSEGHLSVQDAAAQLAAHLLDAQAGERVLDACAAPGGKTCHVLELQPELSELVAVDISPGRLRRVRGNLKRLGLTATLVAGDAAEPETWWDQKAFDRILLDVPCSATGVIRRHPDIKLLRWSTDIAKLAARQSQLLARLWTLLKPGGRLLYASCSALKAENTEVIAAFLAEHPEARDDTQQAARALGFEHALLPQAMGLAIQVGEGEMDGFYYACLTKAAT